VSSRPRKAPAKKTVAAPKEKVQETAVAPDPEAVAETTASAGDSAPEGTDGGVDSPEILEPPVREVARRHCVECFSPDDLVTVGAGDAARDYCPKCKPINA
jgi:hypothetical protein